MCVARIAANHHVGIIKDVLSRDVKADFYVGYEDSAETASQSLLDGGINIAADQIVTGSHTRHRVKAATDVLMFELAGFLASEVVIHAYKIAFKGCLHNAISLNRAAEFDNPKSL